MKKLMIIAALAAATLSLFVCATADSGPPLANPERLTVSYNAKQDATPPLGSSWSGAAYVDFANHEVSAIVSHKLKELKTPSGRPTGFELDGFTGAVIMRNWKSTISDSRTVIGVSAVYHKQLFQSIEGFVGLGASAAGGRSGIGFGVTGGIRIEF